MRVSTQTIKVLTTAAIILCAASLVAWPTLLGPKPASHAPLSESKQYAIRFVEYIGVITLFLVLSGVGAILILRRTSAEFRDLQLQNMRELVEATLEDQKKKANDQVD